MKSSNLDKITKEQTERMNDTIDQLEFDYYRMTPILSSIMFKPSTDIDTAAVDPDGRGVFNPLFTKELTDKELNFLIMHECYHVLLRHSKRFDKLVDKYGETEKSYFSLFNIAADAYINESLAKNKNLSVIDDCITFYQVKDMLEDSLYDMATFNEENTEDLYKRLKKAEEQRIKQGNGADSSQGNEGSEGSTGAGSNANDGSESSTGNNSSEEGFSGGAMSGDIMSDSKINETYGRKTDKGEKESIESVIYDTLRGNYDFNGKKGSLIASNDNLVIGKITECSNANIKDILEKFVYTVSGRNEVHRTWKRPDKRYRRYYPHTKGKLKDCAKDIVFSIDVSGSMSRDKITKVVSVLESLGEKFSVGTKYFFFSNYCSEIYSYTNKKEFIKNMQKAYGGGTSLKAAVRNGEVNQLTNGIVILSDMAFCDIVPSERNLSKLLTIPYMLVGISCCITPAVADDCYVNVK